MAVTQLTDVVVPAEFTTYQIENSMVSTALFQSGVLIPNGVIAEQLGVGAESFTIPFWKDLGEVEADITSDDPTVLSTPQKYSAGRQIVRKSYLHQSWSDMSLASELSGSNPLEALQDRVSAYWDALRLWGFKPLPGQGFAGVCNVLTQRSARSKHSELKVKMHLNAITNGQEAGLAHFAKTDSQIAVIQSADLRRFVRIDGQDRFEGPSFTADTVWLRSSWGENGLARCAYSVDGITFAEIGSPYQMTWGAYRGDRIGMYTSAVSAKRGYVDFSDFRYAIER